MAVLGTTFTNKTRRFAQVNIASALSHCVGRERSFDRGDLGVDPRPALRVPIQIVRRGEDRSDQLRGEPVLEFASMRRAQLSQSQPLPARCCSDLPIRVSILWGDPV
jgi:hypothetical protein